MNNTDGSFPSRITALVTEIAKVLGVGLDRARQVIARDLGLKKDSPRAIYNWESGAAIPHNSDSIVRQLESILIKAKSGAPMEQPRLDNYSTILDLISKLDAKISILEKEIRDFKARQEPTVQQIPRKVYLLKEVTIKEEV